MIVSFLLAILFSGALLPSLASAAVKNPSLLIFVKDAKQYWYKAEGATAAKYVGIDKTAELNINLKKLKVNLKTVKRTTIAFNKPSGKDADKDGLPDQWEVWFGTNQRKSDSDGDGFTDKLELSRGFNPVGAGKLLNGLEKVISKQKQNVIDTFKNKQGTDKLKRFTNLAEYKKFLASNSRDVYSGSFSRFASPSALSKNTFERSEDLFGGVQSNVANDIGLTLGDSSGNAVDYSKTNVQIEGVDESDSVKTDGKNIYLISNGKVMVLKATPAEAASVLATLDVTSPTALYLKDNFLTVIGHDQIEKPWLSQNELRIYDYYGFSATAYIKIFDISNPAAPKLVKDVRLDGNYRDSRLIGNQLYVVINDRQRTQTAPMPLYLLNSKTINQENNLPYYFDMPYTQGNMVSLVSFTLTPSDNSLKSEHYFMPYGGEIFVSLDNFYLTYVKRVNEEDLIYSLAITAISEKLGATDKAKLEAIIKTDSLVLSEAEKQDKIMQLMSQAVALWSKSEQETFANNLKKSANDYYGDIAKELEKTVIHKIALKAGDFTYQSEASVPGQVLNQFAMNERENNFYIATTKQRTYSAFAEDKANDSFSNVYVLNAKLERIGALENLAPGERIYSVRYIDTRAYLVTFRQVDPLFSIDLKDPFNPKVMGELKLPGFSSYLHPYDKDTLIGFGRDADETGRVKGLKIGLFDVSNISAPKELASLSLGMAGSHSGAESNHRRFIFNPKTNLLIFPAQLAEKQNYSTSFSGVAVVDLANKQIKERGRVGFESNNYSDDLRALYIGNLLYSVSSEVMKINNLSDLVLQKEVDLVNRADLKTIENILIIQSGLELYFNDNLDYPRTLVGGETLASSSTVYLKIVPGNYKYTYSPKGTAPAYVLEYFLNDSYDGVPAGKHQATPYAVIDRVAVK